MASVATSSVMAPPAGLDQTHNLPQEDQDALKAAVFQRLHPRVYLERFVREEIRPDGRAFDESREAAVNVGSISTADGSALVRFGGTTIVCGVKAEIAEPALDAAGVGFLVPNVDLPAMCSPRFRPGPPSEEAQVLSERLNQALVASGFVDLEALCIHPGKAAWVLYVDATCINYDGNAFDATLLAMVAALRNTTLPHAKYDEETHRTTCVRAAPRLPLRLAPGAPVAASFGIFDGKYVLADPTAFEEPLLEGAVCAVLGAGGAVVSLSQTGSVLVTGADGAERDVLAECVTAAQRRRVELVRAAFGEEQQQ